MNDRYLCKLGKYVAGCICLCAASCTSTNAWAEVLAYEGFDYSNNTKLITASVGLNGGTGWSGGWDNSQVNPPPPNDSSTVEAASLTYIDSLGNELVTTGGRLLNTGVDGTSTPGRTFSARRSTGSTWFSYLSQRIGTQAPDGTYTRGANLALFDLTRPDNQERIDIGPENSGAAWLNPDTTLPEDRFQLRHVNLVAGVLNSYLPMEKQPPTPNLNANTAQADRYRDVFTEASTHDVNLFVMRIDHRADGGDDVFFWLNPDLNTTPSDANVSGRYINADMLEAAAAAPTPITDPFNGASGGDNEMSFDRLRLFAGNPDANGHAELLLDEIRFGTTFADIAPIAGPTGLPGDYNDNDIVDAADYTVWRDNLGAPNEDALHGNGDNMNGVDPGDYTLWKNNFGSTPGAGGVSAVPEPTAALLVLFASMGFAAGRRR